MVTLEKLQLRLVVEFSLWNMEGLIGLLTSNIVASPLPLSRLLFFLLNSNLDTKYLMCISSISLNVPVFILFFFFFLTYSRN